MTAGVFDDFVAEAIDGSQHESPSGGEGQERTRPIGLSWAGGIRCVPTAPPSASHGARMVPTRRPQPVRSHPRGSPHRGLVDDIETLHLDRGTTRPRPGRSLSHGIDNLVAGKRRASAAGTRGRKLPVPRACAVRSSGPTSLLSTSGPLRRNPAHHLAQLALAVTFLITAKLIDWRNRWCPAPGRPYPLSLLVESYCPSRSTSTGQ